MINKALELFDRGIITIPYSVAQGKPLIDADLGWFQKTPTREGFADQWLKHLADGIAVVCGEYECLDADTKYDPKHTIHDRLLALIYDHLDAGKASRLFIERSPNGGAHIWYRVPRDRILASQTKLAVIEYTEDERFEMGVEPGKSGIKTIIESKGRGGMCTMWPSPGYTVVQGEIETVPVLTEDERELMIMLARSFNEYEAPAATNNYPAFASNRSGKRPGDYFNEDCTPLELLRMLEKEGYKRLREIGFSVYLNRPGAKNSVGVDAKVHTKLNLFVPYSSSIGDFPETFKGYNPFATYAYLYCKGDFAEATRQVASKGHEDPEKKMRQKAVPAVNGQAIIPTAHIPDPFATDPFATEEDLLAEFEGDRFYLSRRPENCDYNLHFCDPENDAVLQPVASPGSLVTILGAAKSRKTTLLGVIVAAALSGRRVSNVIFKSAGKVLWIDPEQGRYYFWETLWRVCVQAFRKEDNDNLYAYSWVDKSPLERMYAAQKVAAIIKPTVIVLDGFADFMEDFNDVKSAMAAYQIVRHWNAQGITVFLVLHFNPQSDKARGHAGTIAINKSDNVITVEADKHDAARVIVKNKFSRGPRFSAFDMLAARDGILTVDGCSGYDHSIGKPEREGEERNFPDVSRLPYAEKDDTPDDSDGADYDADTPVEVTVLNAGDTIPKFNPILPMSRSEDIPF